MEDFERQLNNYRYRQPRNFRRSPVIFNPAADVLAGIEYVEGAFKDRRKKVNLFQQQAEQRRIDMQELVDDTKRIDQTDAMAKMTEQFSNMVTEIYKADIASFDGDRTDYLNKSNNAKKVIGDFGKVIGVVDELSNKYKGMNPAEQEKMVLRSQFAGADGEKKKAYMEFLNDPSKMNIRIQGKDIIITNNGKDLFNGTQLLNSVKSGSNLIEYADDYTKELTEASNEASSGLQSLVKASTIEKAVAGGTKITTEIKNDYTDAVNAYINNLKSSDKIEALINESNFQRFTDLSDVYDESKHGELTKQKMIEYLVNKKFPMYDKITGKAIGDIKIKEDVGAPITQADQQRIKLAKEKFKYERELNAANKAEFEKGIDFYLDRNLNHAKKLREAGLFSEDKINTKEAADKIAALLTEGSAYTYSVTEEDGKFYVEDPEGEIVKGANTPVGLVDLLNQGTIYAQLDKEDASNAAKYVASRMGNINIKTQTELQKAYDKLKPGESITVNGKTYTKPK
jgi:hypothetical protein